MIQDLEDLVREKDKSLRRYDSNTLYTVLQESRSGKGTNTTINENNYRNIPTTGNLAPIVGPAYNEDNYRNITATGNPIPIVGPALRIL